MLPRVRYTPFAVSLLCFLCNLAVARTIVVHPGDSIRVALASASAGDRIQVLPGIYHEGSPGDLNALSITANGIELVGLASPTRPVILENAGGQSFGIWVSPSDSIGAGPQAEPEQPPCALSGARIKGFSLSGFTVRGFGKDGVHLTCIEGFWLTGNVADRNGIYGLFPIASRNGVISNNEASNTPNDAAIYVGQSENVLIAANRVHDNLLGIEVENSRNCSVTGNEVYGNTLGILVDLLPFLGTKTQQNTLVSANEVRDNNRPNTAEPDDILSVFPSGIGILLAAADTTTVRKNIVTGNQFSGVGVVSLCLALSLLGQSCDAVDVDPFPDGNRIIGNLVKGNGTQPIPSPLDAFRADLSWDGTGTGNCWKGNAFGSGVPTPLPSC
ncbi:MAG TPA: parallel beta-helix domain-containing protein [Steroidobacteraceae bacterium]